MAVPHEVQIGADLEVFPGESWNLLVRQWYRSTGVLSRSDRGRGHSPPHIVKAVNKTGTDLEYGFAVAIDKLNTSITDKAAQKYGRAIFTAKKNDSLDHSILGVSVGKCVNDKPGDFIISGEAWIWCNVTDTSHKFCQLHPNQTAYSQYADSSTSGTPILDTSTGSTGNQLVLVLLGGGGSGDGVNAALVKFTVDIDVATDSGGERTPGTHSGTCADKIYEIGDVDVSDVENWSSATGITSGSYGIIVMFDTHPVAVTEFC